MNLLWSSSIFSSRETVAWKYPPIFISIKLHTWVLNCKISSEVSWYARVRRIAVVFGRILERSWSIAECNRKSTSIMQPKSLNAWPWFSVGCKTTICSLDASKETRFIPPHLWTWSLQHFNCSSHFFKGSFLSKVWKHLSHQRTFDLFLLCMLLQSRHRKRSYSKAAALTQYPGKHYLLAIWKVSE